MADWKESIEAVEKAVTLVELTVDWKDEILAALKVVLKVERRAE